MTRSLLLLLPMVGSLSASSIDHLVSYWAFENNTFDTATAGTSTDNGSWVGDFDYDPGKFGQSIEAKGNTYVTIPDSADLRGSSNTISISTWFRIVNFDTDSQTLIAKGSGSNWRLDRQGVTDQMSYSGGADGIFGGAVDDTEWHHIVGVSEAGISTRIYIDGVLIGTGNAPNITDTGNPLLLGNNPDALSRGWKGLIDDVGIFDTALNDYQAAAIYNLGQNPSLAYSLSQVNELFKLGQCPLDTLIQIGEDYWKTVDSDPNTEFPYIQLEEDGTGVVQVGGPPIFSFSANHPVIPPGFPVTVSWEVDPEAEQIIFDAFGDVTNDTVNGFGSYVIDPGPTNDRSYVLGTSGPTGVTVRRVQITVTDQPIVDSFTSSPPIAAPGESITINWTTLNTTSASLDGAPVDLDGSTTFTPTSNATYTLAVTNQNGTVTQSLFVPILAPGEPIISEFLANGDNSLLDEDNDSSDWIQITNPSGIDTVINGDYFLTDDPDELQKWAIPNQTISPGQSVRYFATGKVGTNEPHANFSLRSEGEYLALVKVSNGITTILNEFSDYPRQFTDLSYGLLSDLTTYAYFVTPTPDGENSGDTFEDFVRDTSFSARRGFYTDPQTVTITSETPDALIYYTTNGSEPSENNGILFNPASPPVFDSTTTLRAMATKENHIPTNIDTHTYIFVNRVITQPSNPSGWPTNNVNGQVMDYHMDPGSAVSSDAQGIRDALTSIPSVSIVTDQANLTSSSTGIYVNASRRGREWERAASLELIFPPGYVNPDGLLEGFQENCGLRVRGGFSRNDDNPKHAFRTFFRREYGQRTLNYPLFGNEGGNSFAGIDFRTAQNYSWSFKGPGSLAANNDNSSKNTFMREVFGRDTQRDMDQPYTRSRYVHLYLNGLYWGLFMTQERAEADFGAQYFGGDDDDYDTIKAAGSSSSPSYITEFTDGDNVDWMAGYNLAIAVSDENTGTNTSYFALQGLNSAGDPDPNIPTHIDVDNLIRYMLVVFYNGSFDAPLSTFIGASNNWFAVRNRETDDRGWSFFAHDMEHSLGAYPTARQDRTGPFWFGPIADQEGFERSNPQYIHQYLMDNREYQMKFADIVHQEFFNGGVFTDASVIARFEEREATVDLAIDAEAARWGDSKSGNPLDRTEWALAVNQLKGWTNGRNDEVLVQLRNDDLYPNTNAPVFSQHGGQISLGFNLMMNNPNASGTVYYTTDGSDPREIGGGINASATAGSTVILNGSAKIQARVRISSTNWSALTSAEFATAAAPGVNDLVISEINYHPSDPTASEAQAGFTDDDDFQFIEITNASSSPVDLTNVSLGNEVVYSFSSIANPDDRILAAGASIVVVEDTGGFAERYPGIDAVGPWIGRLEHDTATVDLLLNGNILLFSLTYDDGNGWPRAADGDGYTLVLLNGSMPNDPNSWRLSTTLLGNPSTLDSENFVGNAEGDDNNNGIPNLVEAVLRDGAGTYIHPTASIQSFDDGGGAQNFLTLTIRRYLPVDNATIFVERATTLQGWQTDQLQRISSDPAGDGSVIEVYRMLTPVSADLKNFLRVRVSLN